MNQATGWASDVISAFRQGILTASELWDVLVSHMDDKDAGENVARVIGHFQALTAGGSFSTEPTIARESLPTHISDDVVVIEDLP